MRMEMFAMMRKLICFLLVLVMSLSIACPALAATNSGGNTSSGVTPKTGDQIMTYVIIMIVALAALVAVVLLAKKYLKK